MIKFRALLFNILSPLEFIMKKYIHGAERKGAQLHFCVWWLYLTIAIMVQKTVEFFCKIVLGLIEEQGQEAIDKFLDLIRIIVQLKRVVLFRNSTFLKILENQKVFQFDPLLLIEQKYISSERFF